MASPKESERRRTKDPKSRSPRDATPGGGSGRRSGRGSGCHVETQQFAPKQHAVLEQQSAVDKGSFSSAFSSYLQAKPTGVDFTLSRPSTVRSSASSPATGGVDSLRHAKATTAPNASCSTGDTNRSECRDSESESPHNVVLQILSLGSGSLRLSWVYDWSSVPTEFKDEEAMINGFQVVRRDESKLASAGGDSDIDYEPKRREICRRIKGNVSDPPRLGTALHNILTMSFAWAFYYATQ